MALCSEPGTNEQTERRESEGEGLWQGRGGGGGGEAKGFLFWRGGWRRRRGVRASNENIIANISHHAVPPPPPPSMTGAGGWGRGQTPVTRGRSRPIGHICSSRSSSTGPRRCIFMTPSQTRPQINGRHDASFAYKPQGRTAHQSARGIIKRHSRPRGQ